MYNEGGKIVEIRLADDKTYVLKVMKEHNMTKVPLDLDAAGGTFTRTDGSYYDFLSPQQVANIKDSQDSISFLNSDGVIIEAVAAESTAKVPLLALYCVEDIPQCSVKPRNPLNKNKNENGTIVVPETIVNPKA